jgi:prepilin-type N-terminal cleavage/methylation domain-containing protein
MTGRFRSKQLSIHNQLQTTLRQGFSLIEVLVAILLSGLFFILVLQGTLIGGGIRTDAFEAAQASGWIQEDIENIKYLASTYYFASLTADAPVGASSIAVNSTDTFTNNDTLFMFTRDISKSSPTIYRITSVSGNILNIQPPIQQKYSMDDKIVNVAGQAAIIVGSQSAGSNTINVDSSSRFLDNDQIRICGTSPGNCPAYTVDNVNGNQLTIRPSLVEDVANGTGVGLSKCGSPNISTKGYADALQDLIQGSNVTTGSDTVTLTKTIRIETNTGTVNGKSFDFIRKTEVVPFDPPFNRLQVSYKVSPPLTPEDTFITEVMPDAALYCP